jgi:transcriptional regulator with XRE-family HTH domain
LIENAIWAFFSPLKRARIKEYIENLQYICSLAQLFTNKWGKVNNYIWIFKQKLNKYNIKQRELAFASERSENSISGILNGKTSPTLETFALLIDACEKLHPGFKAEYHRDLMGEKLDLNQLVSSLSSAELSTLLICAGQRINHFQPKAIAS